MTTKQAKETVKKHKLVQRGFQNAVDLVLASDKAGLPLSLACSVTMQESGGANEFGHDPTTSIPDRWKGSKVTWAKYHYYKLRRSRYGMQGVGPMQLTWWATQDQADHMGGCHKPYYNFFVGFKALASNIRMYGTRDGIRRYNGTGPAAAKYADTVLGRQGHYHKIFAQD